MSAVMQVPVSKLADEDMQGAPAALIRAGQRAREIAARTGTPLIISENGVIVRKVITLDMVTTGSRPALINKEQQGYSLVELAVVMLIVSLLIGGLMLPISAQQDVRARQETEKVLTDARESLLGYAIANGRLPCPASSTSNGIESFCTNADPLAVCGAAIVGFSSATTAHGRCSNPYDGFLPAVTLGFTPITSDGYATDGWNTGTPSAVRYAVTDYVLPPALLAGKTTCQNTGTTGISFNPFTCINGMKDIFAESTTSDLTVCNAGANVTSAGTASASCSTGTLTSDAVAVIYSLGKNTATGGTDTDENQNYNPQSTVAADRAFVKTTSSDVFDDQLTWISRGILFGRLVSAGKLP